MTENLLVKQLREVASKLSRDLDVQGKLMQEMFVNLVRIQTTQPGETPAWYLKSCEFQARQYLNPALARDERSSSQPVGQIEIEGERITTRVLERILPHLSDKQHQVLFLLMKGYGIREAARELGVTHPAVIKHRKKIARIARELLREGMGATTAVPNSVEESGNGSANGNGEAHAA